MSWDAGRRIGRWTDDFNLRITTGEVPLLKKPSTPFIINARDRRARISDLTRCEGPAHQTPFGQGEIGRLRIGDVAGAHGAGDRARPQAGRRASAVCHRRGTEPPPLTRWSRRLMPAPWRP